ncbi:MAG: hypothetical protein ABUT20_15350 [Bacteroidota bacterium]
MPEQFDILRRLTQYEITPPAEALLRIMESLGVQDANNSDDDSLWRSMLQLQEFEIKAPQFLFPFIEKQIASSLQLSQLRNLEVSPPFAAYSEIMEKIERGGTGDNGNNLVSRILSLNAYKSIAASIIILVIGWLIYKLTVSPADINKDVAKQIVTPVLPTTKKDSVVANVVGINKKQKSIRTKKSQPQIASDDFFYQKDMTIDDYKFPIIDNDLLVTFAGFSYSQVPDFISKPTENTFTIKVDQYSSISVSESMSKMIRNMNQFRSNKKPTRRARKERARLEKWKKADTEQFDKSLKNNPLDPIDLAEFVF